VNILVDRLTRLRKAGLVSPRLVGRAVGRKLINARSVSGHDWEHNRRSLSGFTEAAKDIVATLLHDHHNWRRFP